MSLDRPDAAKLLRETWETFGLDHVRYGSDWPNRNCWRPAKAGIKLVRAYLMAKGPQVAQKHLWKDSVKVYKWITRDPSQPDPRTA